MDRQSAALCTTALGINNEYKWRWSTNASGLRCSNLLLIGMNEFWVDGQNCYQNEKKRCRKRDCIKWYESYCEWSNHTVCRIYLARFFRCSCLAVHQVVISVFSRSQPLARFASSSSHSCGVLQETRSGVDLWWRLGGPNSFFRPSFSPSFTLPLLPLPLEIGPIKCSQGVRGAL